MYNLQGYIYIYSADDCLNDTCYQRRCGGSLSRIVNICKLYQQNKPCNPGSQFVDVILKKTHYTVLVPCICASVCVERERREIYNLEACDMHLKA